MLYKYLIRRHWHNIAVSNFLEYWHSHFPAHWIIWWDIGYCLLRAYLGWRDGEALFHQRFHLRPDHFRYEDFSLRCTPPIITGCIPPDAIHASIPPVAFWWYVPHLHGVHGDYHAQEESGPIETDHAWQGLFLRPHLTCHGFVISRRAIYARVALKIFSQNGNALGFVVTVILRRWTSKAWWLIWLPPAWIFMFRNDKH